ETWTGLALLAEKAKGLAAGLAVLTQAETELGDVVELRLARAHLLGLQGKASVDKILALAKNAERFKAEDRARLVAALGEALCYAGDYAAGRNLVRELAELPSRENDSRLRLLLFDLAQRDGDEAGMDEALAGLVRVEGGDGALSHYGQAIRQIGRARKNGG